MIVVSDTSPLNYLVLIEFQHILPELFERILIPQAVRQELQSAAAPDAIKRFLATEPEWLETLCVGNRSTAPTTRPRRQQRGSSRRHDGAVTHRLGDSLSR